MMGYLTKTNSATGAARISRLQCRSMVDHLSQTQNATGSSPVIKKQSLLQQHTKSI